MVNAFKVNNGSVRMLIKRGAAGLYFLALCSGMVSASLLHTGTAGAASPPASPPVQICGNASQLDGPASAPTGSVTVPAGDNSSFLTTLQPNTTYYFASGTHTLGTGQFSQIQPQPNDTFIGAPGAIIDGQNHNNFAFVGNDSSVTGVTVEYLTIQNFIAPGGQGAVNTNSNDHWTIAHDTVQNVVPGAAMMIGSNNDIEYNCLTHNGEYAFNGYQAPGDPESSSLTSGPQHITLSNNEISLNNTCNWDQISGFPITEPAGCSGAGQFNGCGCDGGGKFWAADQVTFDNNYVHDNYSIGLWADTNNTGFDVENNYFANNFGEAIIYEISYNAVFKNNTFIGNGNFDGPQNPGFPTPAVYISESGGDSRVPGFSSGSLQVTQNNFTNNYGGVVLWENADRYCSSSANSSTGDCTLVNPSVANLTTCANASDLAQTPYIDDCRWKTQNVSVDHNTFNFDPSASGSACTTANTCGFNALFSQYGSYPPYTGWFVPNNISNNQNNVFASNTYTGPWNFMGFNQGDAVAWSDWNSGFDDWNGSGDHFNAQDAGSTFNTQTSTPPPATPTNVTATANSATSVTVNWSASTDTRGPGLGGYYVLRGGTQIASVNASTTSYTDTSVSPSTQYSYTVEAFDTASPANVSSPSSAATVTTPSSSGGGSSYGPIVGIASKCIDNRNNKNVNGNTIQLYMCNQTNAQQWTFTSAGAISNQSGYCIEPAGGKTASQTLVVLEQCNGAAAQVWSLNKTTHAIVNVQSGMCLDDKHSGTANGNPIWIYKCNQTKAQQWHWAVAGL